MNRIMNAVLEAPETHVEADEYSQAPLRPNQASQANGDSHGDAPLTDATKPQISIADALARNAAQREQLIAIGRDSIQKIEQARADSNAEADKRIADIRAQIGEPAKVRRPGTPKNPAPEAVAPAPKPGRAPKAISKALESPAFSLMEVGKAYSVREAKELFQGGKPGEILAGAIAAKLVKRGGGAGMSATYTRMK
jgi:hypothetical protein